jgi:hypothetical protein
VSGSGDKSVRVWEAESGRCGMVLVNEDERGPGGAVVVRDSGVTSVAINPIDGKCVVTVRLYIPPFLRILLGRFCFIFIIEGFFVGIPG